jgi:hypothetical protein
MPARRRGRRRVMIRGHAKALQKGATTTRPQKALAPGG